MFAHIHVYYNSVKSTDFWHTVILFFSAKIRLIFHICKKNGGKMQNNYFVFIKLRVGEYVEYIWKTKKSRTENYVQVRDDLFQTFVLMASIIYIRVNIALSNPSGYYSTAIFILSFPILATTTVPDWAEKEVVPLMAVAEPSALPSRP